MDNKLTLQVVEILHYSIDVDAAVEFYEEKLGWPVIWQSPGNLAVIDAGGAYQLTIVAAMWTHGWEEGDPPPPAQLAMESQDLAADQALLEQRGLAGLEVGGDPESMLTMEIVDPAGFRIFAWQDSAEAGATKMVEEYRATNQPPARYSLGECLFFVEDMEEAERFYTGILGFAVRNRHGGAFTGLNRDDGPVLGLYNAAKWWDSAEPVAPGTVRLFLECPGIAAEHTRLTEAGAVPGGLQSADDGLSWFTVTDPDGNCVTLWEYYQG